MLEPYTDFNPRRLIVLAGDQHLRDRWIHAFHRASPGCPYTPYGFEAWADLDPDYARALHARAATNGETTVLCGPNPTPGRMTLLDLPESVDHADLMVSLTPEETVVLKNRMGPIGRFLALS